jgi:hypothetical protein
MLVWRKIDLFEKYRVKDGESRVVELEGTIATTKKSLLRKEVVCSGLNNE